MTGNRRECAEDDHTHLDLFLVHLYHHIDRHHDHLILVDDPEIVIVVTLPQHHFVHFDYSSAAWIFQDLARN
jgi:hypothetical protein